MRFVEFWKERTGRLPQELVFDSKLTTYANLNELNNMDIDFITLRRRSDKILEQLRQTPGSAWRQIQLSNVSRAFRTPKVLERMIQLRDYEVPIRQLAIRDLGHDKPTLLLTNQLRRSATKLIDRYAQRMLIENGIADGIDFFHMDALSSAVAMKINYHPQSGWFDEGPSKGPPPCGRGLKPPEVLLLLVFFLFLLVADVVPNNGLV